MIQELTFVVAVVILCVNIIMEKKKKFQKNLAFYVFPMRFIKTVCTKRTNVLPFKCSISTFQL